MFRKSLIPMFASIAILTVAAHAQIGALPKRDVSLKDATDPKFRVGDVWEYKTRPAEERSRLIVVKVDNSPEFGIIVHIAVDNLTWKNCQNNPLPEAVPHMPFARKALETSVTSRVGTTQSLPDYQNGYEEWKAAYSKKHAGIYIVAVQDAVSVAERTYRAGIGCDSEANRQTASR